jgi:hypothetical protein
MSSTKREGIVIPVFLNSCGMSIFGMTRAQLIYLLDRFKIAIVLVLYFNPWVEASAGGL